MPRIEVKALINGLDCSGGQLMHRICVTYLRRRVCGMGQEEQIGNGERQGDPRADRSFEGRALHPQLEI
jgi:hypothetical protein